MGNVLAIKRARGKQASRDARCAHDEIGLMIVGATTMAHAISRRGASTIAFLPASRVIGPDRLPGVIARHPLSGHGDDE